MHTDNDRLLPALRVDIELMPSPIADRPGYLLRDPMRYTDDVLVVPPVWGPVLASLDGRHTLAEARARMLEQLPGAEVPLEAIAELVSALEASGYVDGAQLEERISTRRRDFAAATVREPAHAGSAYPDNGAEATSELVAKLGGEAPESTPFPVALAAPHVSPEGGYASYRQAYRLPPLERETTFVVLGTSHYGAPERFGTTAKPFRTPLGTTEVDGGALELLRSRGGEGIVHEDYCHRVEHSVEFQVLFLQHRLRGPFRILPILCGPFVDSLSTGRRPEELDSNRRVFDALGELAARRDDLVWVLGVDLAHIGLRYGHRAPARANQGRMNEVKDRDEARLERVCAGDAEGLHELVHPGADDLNWCGYSPIYTYLRSAGAARRVRGESLSYEQWNIDDGSVVSFAALHFFDDA